MTREYTYQDLDQFFAVFKQMPEYITLEDAKQFIKNPRPSSFQMKGGSLKLWSILTTAALVITVSSVLYFSLPAANHQNPEQPHLQENGIPPDNIMPVSPADTSKSVSQEFTKPAPIVQTNQDKYESVANELTESDRNNIIKSLNPKNHASSEKPIEHNRDDIATSLTDLNQHLLDETIDGNPYIIDDLSLDELRRLGFDIQSYVVFYRNTWPEANCLYVSRRENMSSIYYVTNEEELKMERKPLLEIDTLINDTLPKTQFSIRIQTERRVFGQNPNPAYYQFKVTDKNYYPVYISKLDGSVSGINSIQKFDQSKDTLVPIVIPFSRLNCSQSQDLIFWFHATENFYNDIPERHNQIQSFISNNKRNKKTNPDALLVDYDIDRWISKRLYPPYDVIDGTDFIMDLTLDEKKIIGLFRNKENDLLVEYYYLTPWGQGSGRGGNVTRIKSTNIPGKNSIPYTEYDTVFKVDYLPSIVTDTLGNPMGMSTTGKYIQSTLIENDRLIPIKDSDMIFWFTQSDSLWTLLPERYRHLQEIYQRILFTKSIYPEIDLVRYFKKGREHVDMDVAILDLNQSELEDLGFQFIKDSLAIQSSVYNKDWVQLKFNLSGMELKMLKKGRDRFLNSFGLRGGIWVINESNKDWYNEKNRYNYDELIKSPFQGFQIVMVTDELGHELIKFHSKAREEYLEGKESQYIIPVRVPMDKYFSEFSETKIIWFTPTEEFFDRLPDRINKDLRHDYYSLTGNLKISSCTYFEECKSTLKLEDFNIYPNPAKESVTISFNASEEVSGNIYLLDIKGSIINTLASKAKIINGDNEFHYILNDVQPGIYLVAVQSDNGVKTGRLIVSE